MCMSHICPWRRLWNVRWSSMFWRKSGADRSDCNWGSCDAWLLLIAAAQNLPQISGSFRGLLLDDFRTLGLGGCFHHLSQQRRGERAVRIIMGFSQHDLWHRLWPVCAEITAHTLRQWRLGHRRLCSGQWVSGGCGCGGWRQGSDHGCSMRPPGSHRRCTLLPQRSCEIRSFSFIVAM